MANKFKANARLTQDTATQARDYVATGAKLLKVKLDGEQVIERVRAVREAAADVQIVLDANKAWTGLNLEELFNQLAEFDVAMIEQPLPQQHDASLAHIKHPIPLCADESCHTSSQLSSLWASMKWSTSNSIKRAV